MLKCNFVSFTASVCRHFPMMRCEFWPLRSQSLVAHGIVRLENSSANNSHANAFLMLPSAKVFINLQHKSFKNKTSCLSAKVSKGKTFSSFSGFYPIVISVQKIQKCRKHLIAFICFCERNRGFLRFLSRCRRTFAEKQA